MFEPKVVAVGASIGFVLSFLTGLLSGAAFGVVFVRALVMAFFFGGILVLAKGAIMRFLPELFSANSQETQAQPDIGTAVDITIDGSDSVHTAFSGKDEDSSAGMVPDFLSGVTETTPSGEVSDLESHEFVPMYTAGSMNPPSVGRPDSRFVGSAPADDKPSPIGTAGKPAAPSPKAVMGGLDVLPDIQDFVPQISESGSEADSINDDSGGFSGGVEGMGSFKESDIKTSGVESELMAKAIRTILTREG